MIINCGVWCTINFHQPGLWNPLLFTALTQSLALVHIIYTIHRNEKWQCWRDVSFGIRDAFHCRSRFVSIFLLSSFRLRTSDGSLRKNFLVHICLNVDICPFWSCGRNSSPQFCCNRVSPNYQWTLLLNLDFFYKIMYFLN